MGKYLANNKGYAMIIALLAITVISILGLTIMANSNTSKKLATEENKDQTSFYIAEGALNEKLADIDTIETVFKQFYTRTKSAKLTSAQFLSQFEQEVRSTMAQSLKPTTYFSEGQSCSGVDNCSVLFERADASAKVQTTLTVVGESFNFKVVSTGFVEKKKRVVSSTASYLINATEIKTSSPYSSKYVIHARNNITLTGGYLEGTLGLESAKPTNNPAFPFGDTSWGKYVGAPNSSGNKTTYECTKHSTTKDCLENGLKNGDLSFNSPIPSIPDFPLEQFTSLMTLFTKPATPTNYKALPTTRPLPSGDYKLTVGELQNLKDLTLDIGSNSVNLYIENAQFDYRTIQFKGSGNINLYTKAFEISGGGTLNFDNNNLTVFSETNFTLSGGSLISSVHNLTINTMNDILISGKGITKSNDVVMNTMKDFNISGAASLGDSNSLTISAANSFSLEGSGTLGNIKTNATIKANNVSFNSSTTINVGDQFNVYAYNKLGLTNTVTANTKNFNIYYTGKDKPAFNGGFTNKVSLDFLYAPIAIGGGVKINGNIILRGKDAKQPYTEVLINGGSVTNTPNFFYAPNFNVKVDEGANFYGSIIAYDINIANGSVYYKEAEGSSGGSSGSSTSTLDVTFTPIKKSALKEVN